MCPAAENQILFTHAYSVYGLTCISNVPIPGFYARSASSLGLTCVTLEVSSKLPKWVEDIREIEAVVRYSQPAEPKAGNPGYTVAVRGSAEAFELSYSDGAEFVLSRKGTRVWARWSSSLTLSDLAVYIRGPLMGFLLRQRGTISLHASAVSFQGRTMAFCGESGSGKSTTAAALALSGSAVLSDDITALEESGGGFAAQAGCPVICLWPDSVEKLCGAPDALPRLTETWEKRYLQLEEGRPKFEPRSQQLSIIYLLGRRSAETSAPWIEEISPREGFVELVKNTYMNWLLDRNLRAAEFELLGKVADSVPIRRLTPHADPGRIGNLCELIHRDVDSVESVPVCHRR